MDSISPVQEVNYNGTRFWIKRDDLVDPYVSGNKFRKLKYVVRDALAEGRTHLITFGGAFSNHIIATAAAAYRNNLRSSAFIRGEAVENPVLDICKKFGMQLHFVSRTAYLDKRGLFDAYFGSDRDTYFIDEGGAGQLAQKGCAELISELPSGFNHIFCSAGTGSTASGLLQGLAEQHYPTTLHVVPALKNAGFIGDVIRESTGSSNFKLHTGFHFGGYAKVTGELIDFINDFEEKTSIPLDPVYTGKLAYAICTLYTKGVLKQEDKVLMIHTGGLTGKVGMQAKFDTRSGK